MEHTMITNSFLGLLCVLIAPILFVRASESGLQRIVELRRREKFPTLRLFSPDLTGQQQWDNYGMLSRSSDDSVNSGSNSRENSDNAEAIDRQSLGTTLLFRLKPTKQNRRSVPLDSEFDIKITRLRALNSLGLRSSFGASTTSTGTVVLSPLSSSSSPSTSSSSAMLDVNNQLPRSYVKKSQQLGYKALKKFSGSGSRNCFFTPIQCMIQQDMSKYKKLIETGSRQAATS